MISSFNTGSMWSDSRGQTIAIKKKKKYNQNQLKPKTAFKCQVSGKMNPDVHSLRLAYQHQARVDRIRHD